MASGLQLEGFADIGAGEIHREELVRLEDRSLRREVQPLEIGVGDLLQSLVPVFAEGEDVIFQRDESGSLSDLGGRLGWISGTNDEALNQICELEMISLLMGQQKGRF
jgi:hypothetical protein